MYFSTQKWAFYFGKSADFLFRISVWSVEFCVVANRSRAFFVCVTSVAHTFLFFGGKEMRKLLSLLAAIVLVFALSACGKSKTTSNTETITDLGVCSAENTSLNINARNPWDIAVIDNFVYTAVGDFDSNSGPTSIWRTNIDDLKWESSGQFEQEAFIRFLNLNDKIIAIGADPMSNSQYAEAYVLRNNKWENFVQIKDALHIFDAEYFNDEYFFGVGYGDNNYPIVKFSPETKEYINVPLYKNGTDVIAALSQNGDIKYKRVYDLFSVDQKLFCAFSCSYNGGKTTIEFFEYKDNKFEFCQALKMSGIQMEKPIKNQILLNADAVINNTCYLSFGNLYTTTDFVKFDKVSVPEDACVTDMFVDKNNDLEILYILASKKVDSVYKNTIYRVENNDLIEVVTFNKECSALSFAKQGNDFYIGLGGDGLMLQDTGRIIKITVK